MPGQTEPTELYRKYRPSSLTDVIGQPKAVRLVQEKLKEGTFPHVTLFAGPTGVGKTTIARIVVGELGCTDHNLVEINCADVRGIDSVREIRQSLDLSPMGGKCRVWLLDEIVQLPAATQKAFLHVLENVPQHVYFLLCTSDTSGLLPTFLGRCFQVNMLPLSKADLTRIVERAAASEGRLLSIKIMGALVEKASGSGRNALQLLEAVLAAEEDQQMTVLDMVGATEEKQAEFLARTLMRKAKWEEFVPALEAIGNSEVETIRRQVLDYCAKALVGKWKGVDQNMAYLVIRAFEDSWHASGRAGLIAAVWKCCLTK